MFVVLVEANNGDRLSVLDDEGYVVGNGILGFTSPLSLYCFGIQSQDEHQDIKAWFDPMNNYFEGNLCQIVYPLLKCRYSGDWNFNEDEYEFFKHRIGTEVGMSEEEFKKILKHSREAWTPIGDVIKSVEALEKYFEGDLDFNFWINETVISEFKYLQSTLQLLSSRGARKIRINIT